MSDSGSYDSEDYSSSELYESSNSSEDSGSLPDDEEIQESWKWNYNVRKKKIKLFNDESNIIHRNDFKFCSIDASKLLFTV